MDPLEAQLKKEIATTLLITMGGEIEHFEGSIDPCTGTIHVDHVFRPLGRAVDNDKHRIKTHAVMRVYTSHVDPKSGSKFSYLLGCEAIDLAALMTHTVRYSLC